MLNLLWLLLPVAFVSGWWASLRNARDNASPSQLQNNQTSYFRGLSYLINEQTDKVVELFVSVSDMNQEMFDTQLAMGNLFRRQGEVDRAIQIHQHLVDRSEQGTDSRANALLELARDFNSAGLLDRSEELFQDLLNDGHHLEEAFANLLSVYEQESEWLKAVELLNDSTSEQRGLQQTRLSHYYCELAEDVVKQNDKEQARKYLKCALKVNENSARANILRGNLALEREDYTRAIECYRTVEQLNPEFIPEIVEPLFNALFALGNDAELRNYIDHIRDRNNSYSVIKTAKEMIEKLDGVDAAELFFKRQLLRRPSLKGLRDWASSEMRRCKPKERDKIAIVIGMLDTVVDDKPAYACNSCGFKGKALHWRCPSCHQWETVVTVIGAEGE